MGQQAQQVSKSAAPAASVVPNAQPFTLARKAGRSEDPEGSPKDIAFFEKVSKFACKWGSKVPGLGKAVKWGICKPAEFSQKIGAQNAGDMQVKFEKKVNEIPILRGIYNFFWKLAPGDMENGWEKK